MLRLRVRSAVAALVLGSIALFGHADQVASPSPGAAHEERLLAISTSVRCLVCEGQSLYVSPAALAQDLRREIRVAIDQGKTDQQIVDALLSRYSDFLLREDPYGAAAWFWSGALAAMVIGGIGVLFYKRLSSEDRAHKGFPFRLR